MSGFLNSSWSISFPRAATAVFLTAIICFSAGCDGSGSPPRAQNGVLDLTAWDFEKDGITNLNGEWEFYWDRLLTPSAFKSDNPPEKDGYIHLPCIWNGYELNGKKLTGKGHATFRLLLELNGRSRDLSLTTRNFLTASRIWIDDEPFTWNGTVGDNLDSGEAEITTGVTVFVNRSDTVEIVLQVSNYHSLKGGPNLPVSMGAREQIRKRRFVMLAVDVFVIGVLLIMAFYHFILFLFRRKERAVLYFSIISLALASNSFIYGVDGRLIAVFFQNLSYDFICRLELVSWCCTVPVIAMFLKSLFKERFSGNVVRAAQLATALFLLVIIAMPLGAVETAMPVYAVLVFLGTLYGMYVIYKAFAEKQAGTGFVLAGFFCFLLFAIHDLLLINEMGLLPVSLANIGWMICIVFQSLALSSIYAKSFKAMEENLALRDEIAERKRMEKELRLMQIRLSEMLNTITEAVIAVNENGEVCFLNSIASGLTGYSERDLVGRDIRDIFPDNTGGAVTEISEHISGEKEDRSVFDNIHVSGSDGVVKNLDLFISTLELEDEPMYIFIFRKPDSSKKVSVKTEIVIDELNRNREKLRNFEETLSILTPGTAGNRPELLHDVKVVDKALEHIQSYLVDDEIKHNKRAMAVEIMNLCLELWDACTDNSGKIAMAEKSGIWKIYTDRDGGKRTQGLERYLSLRTISKRPRWKKVVETADFILMNCRANSRLRQKLEASLSRFRMLL